MDYLGSDNGGDVLGPITSTDDAIVRFDGTNGVQIQDSTATIDDSGNSTFRGTETIIGQADLTQLTILGAAGQTADLISVRDSASLPQASISALGGAHFNQQKEALAVVRMDGATENYVFNLIGAEDSIGMGTDTTQYDFKQFGGSTFTVRPRLLIEVGDTGAQTTFVSRRLSNTATRAPLIEYLRARDSSGAPAIVQNGDTIGGFRLAGYDGVKYIGQTGMFFTCDGAPGVDVMPINMDIRVGDFTVAATIAFKATSAGNVGFRTNNPVAPITAEGGTVFNYSQVDADFRIAGNGIAFPLDYDAGNARLNFGGASSGSIMRLTEGAIDINRLNNPYDFRIRTQTYSKFFWVDGGLDVAGFGSTFGTEWLRISPNAVTINETGDALTVFRVEGDTDQNLFRSDPSTDRIGIGNAAPDEKFDVSGNIGIRNGNELRFRDVGNSNYVGFEAPALTGNQIWVLPDADGSANQVLTTDGGGNLSWSTAGATKTTTRITNADSPYTVLSSDEVIYCDTDGGAITVNLPAGVDGKTYKVINTGSSTNDVTLDPNGTEQIYGSGAGTSITLIDSEWANITFETTENWW